MTVHGTASGHSVALATEENPRQGRMTSHRTISLILTLLAGLMTVAPSSVFAGPLLGGYGGPGAGNQAILGSALLNGPPGGGGTGAGSTGAAGSAPSSSASPSIGVS